MRRGKRKGKTPRAYDTRIDRFRRANAIDHLQWALESGMTRSHFLRVRLGKDIHLKSVVRVVKAASRILRRQVRASELYDLGDDEPLNTQVESALQQRPHAKTRELFRTPLDDYLLRTGILPAELARRAGLSRQALVRMRARRGTVRVSTVRKLIRALRAMGRDVKSSDFFDFGDSTSGRTT
jgi:predicted transcriptional regulator